MRKSRHILDYSRDDSNKNQAIDSPLAMPAAGGNYSFQDTNDYINLLSASNKVNLEKINVKPKLVVKTKEG